MIHFLDDTILLLENELNISGWARVEIRVQELHESSICHLESSEIQDIG
jgi:hypothetical protein